MRVLKLVFVALMLFAVAAPPASAATITISGCPSCFGLTYTLEVNSLGGTQYEAFLDITGTFTGSMEARFISAVEFKVTNDVMDPVIVTDAPGHPMYWDASVGGLSNAGCTGSGAGFLCSEEAPPYDASLGYTGAGFSPIVLAWAWTFNGAALFPELEGAHIGAKFNNAEGTLNGQVMSQSYAATAAVPEPTSMMLLGTGLLGAALLLNRRRR